ncbi:MAG: flotillin domain-containing protein [Burkholderiaceae bacterium]
MSILGKSVALLAWIVLGLVAIAVFIAFMQRFYRKATRELALLRTGAGGQHIALDGGFFALPILHKVEEINMRAHRIAVRRTGDQSLLTEDRLRVDVQMEFRVRVAPGAASVAAAAQAFGARTLRSEELSQMLEGRFADVVQSSASVRTLDALHQQRAEFVNAVRDALRPELESDGLRLESVALVYFDQTPFSTLSENNVFNSVGMRKVAEIVATNRKLRAQTEADAEISVSQTQLTATKRRIEMTREQEEAEIVQRLALANSRARSDAEMACASEAAQQTIERARLEREQGLAAARIDRDQALERARLESSLSLEVQRVAQAIDLSRRQEEEAMALIDGERARTQLALAQEAGQTERERVVQQRQQELAQARSQQDSALDLTRVKAETARLLATAQAQADADRMRADGRQAAMAAEAAGAQARNDADNRQSPALMHQRLELARIEALPQLAEKIAKPMEKIESIRINHLSGFGGGGKSGNASAGPLDALYDMALQLPVLKRLGETLGTDMDMTIPQLARAQTDHARAVSDHQKNVGALPSSTSSNQPGSLP